MSKNHWLVSGVGRSGTTFVYSALLNAARAQQADVLGRYEPLLWGEPVWDKLPGRMGSAFSTTDAISSRGVFAHTQAPLFLEDSHEVFDSFVAETFPADTAVVAKEIRGAGRLTAFLKRDPKLKIIHLVRNPLDVVNSGLLHFSFFGAEFHPSDEPRFNAEAAEHFAEIWRATGELSEAGKALEWWRLMNEAALRSASRFPQRVKVVAYESLMEDETRALRDMVDFLGGTPLAVDGEMADEAVGPITSYVALRAVDRDLLMPALDRYLADRRIFGRSKNRIDKTAVRASLEQKYAACKEGGPFQRAIAPDSSPTRVRALVSKAQQDTEAVRSAGVRQAERIAHQVSESNAKSVDELEGRISSLMKAASDRHAEQLAKIQADFAAREERAQRDVATLKALLEARDKAALLLADELKAYQQEIAALKDELETRDKRIAELDADLATETARVKSVEQEARKDLAASQQAVARLRDRVAALGDQQKGHDQALDRMRLEKRETADKLRQTEHRLKQVAGEREHYRQQLAELGPVLAPRLRTIVTLKPLRYVLRQRQRIKSGAVEIDSLGLPVSAKSKQ